MYVNLFVSLFSNLFLKNSIFRPSFVFQQIFTGFLNSISIYHWIFNLFRLVWNKIWSNLPCYMSSIQHLKTSSFKRNFAQPVSCFPSLKKKNLFSFLWYVLVITMCVLFHNMCASILYVQDQCEKKSTFSIFSVWKN